MQEAVGRNEYWRLVDSKGRPPGLIGLWSNRAITFVENHDTGSTLNHWPFPWANLQAGYAYILTHPGTPCVFYDHQWSDADGLGMRIQKLIALRKQLGINARSQVVVRRATSDCYAATIDGVAAMKIGHGDYSPNKDESIMCPDGGKRWHCSVSGVNFAVWVEERFYTPETEP
jgi:alpha-amylase